MPSKPMLAAQATDLTKIVYPVLVSPKLDGIRCLIDNGVAYSRSLKRIPNLHVQRWASHNRDVLQGLDGELIVGSHDKDVFRRTTSGVMSVDGEPAFTFFAFDHHDMDKAHYVDRFNWLKEKHRHTLGVSVLVHHIALNEEELLRYESEWVKQGYEGLMVNSLSGIYKNGRSTEKEGTLLKVKRFTDAEATVVGFEERMHNDNVATTNELGQTERSTVRAGLRPAGDLGSLLVDAGGVVFNIGSGFTLADRASLWAVREGLIGKLVKYKYFEQGGYDKPRHPIFIGFRSEDDL